MRITLGRSGWRATLLASTALLAATEVQAQSQWTGASSSDWFTAGNWNPAGVPGAASDVTLDTITPSPTVIGAPGATVGSELNVGFDATGQLTIQSGGTLTMGPSVLVVGRNVGSFGSLTVSGPGSTLTSGGELAVGGAGEGVMRVENGGAVSTTGAAIGIAQSSATSVVTVTGAGSTWTNSGSLLVGGLSDGKGQMFVTDGGRVSSADGTIGASNFATGAVTVSGAGTTWTNSGNLVVSNVGSGFLRIENGGKVSNAIGFIGKAGGTDSTGSVIVTGAGSTWTNSSNLLIGGGSPNTPGQGTLVVANGGVVSSSGSGIGTTAGSTGDVTVQGAGSRWTTGALRVGNPGKGTLTITDGGTVISDFDSIFIANGKDATGTVTVSGAGSTLNAAAIPLYVGVSGTGTLRIENGGKVSNKLGIVASEEEGVTSAVTVTGPGSTWTNDSVIVGGFGNGTLTVRDGGTVSAATFSIIANKESSVSTATVGGAGSIWTNTGDFVVGNFGNGTLRVESGGAVANIGASFIGGRTNASGAVTVTGADATWTNSGDLIVGVSGNGTLRIENGGKVTSAFGFLAADAAAVTGEVTVTGTGSTWTTGSVMVGGFGRGTLTVSDGGTVTATAFSIIGNKETSVSKATVSGIGSAWINTGDFIVGNFGDGTLRIESGGMVTNTGAGVIGRFADSKGAVIVAGNGSTWTNSDNLSIGFSGKGTLSIENGGKVSNALGIIASETAGLTGAVTVTGLGSTWTNASVIVGGFGNGTLTVNDGGTVSAATFSIIGNREGAVSTATVSGTGSTWTNTGDFVVGNFGDGTLNVESGGTVTNKGFGFIGGRAGAKGAVVVAGNGSTWTSDSLVVGSDGTGALTVSDGGTAQANESVRVAAAAGSTGVVNIGAAEGKSAVAPGALQATALAFGDGTGTLVLNHTGTNHAFTTPIAGNGTIRQLAGVTALTADSVTFSGTTAVVGGTLRVDGILGGTVAVGADGTLGGVGTISGPVSVYGTLSAGASPGTLTVGTLTLNTGATARFELTTPGVVGGNDPVIGNDLVVVTNTLTLGGRLDARTAAGGFYRLFNYGGTLAGSFATIDVTGTGGFAIAGHELQISIPGQVNLSVLGVGQTLQFWDGTDTAGNGVVDGGAGTWSTAGTNWTGQPGQAAVNGAWGGSVGVFTGAAGAAVTVTGSQAFDTLQFSTNGYTLGGGSLTLSPASGTNGTVTVDSGISATIATPLVDGSGTGLLKVGGGTLILTATNTYSGGTTIAAGTLQLGNGGTTGTIVGNVTNNGVLAINRVDTVTFNGAITGDGAFEQRGSGTTILTANNTYTGGTIIAAGTLQVGDGGTTGAIVGNISNGGTLAIHRADTVTLGGTITGSGTLRQIGTGTTVLTGNNTHAGGTTINAGTLQLDDGGTAGSITGPVANNGTLAINRAGNLTLDSAISGAGTLRHIGTGTTTLSATSTYSGGTSVENGRLVVNGSIANSTVTLSGGTLGGNGTIRGLVVNSGSTVAPGNSIGTLNVAGNISFAAGSTYTVEIEPAGTSDRLHAAGTATLTGAAVSVVKAPGAYTAGTRYTILTADAGLSGTFAGFTQNLPFIDLALAYDPNSVFLDVTRNTVTFCGVAATSNQCSVARAAEGLGAGNPLFDAIASLPDAASAQQAFNALSGEIHASTRTALIEDSHHLRDAVITRTRLAGITAAAPQFAALAQATDQSQRPQDGTAITAWMQGFGALARTSGNGNAASLKRSTGGVVVGADARLDDTWTIGIAAGYSRTNLDVNGRSSRADIDSYHLALYGGAQFGPLGFRLGASHTWHSIDSTRRIAFPGLADSARADYKARTTQVFGDVGYALALGSVALEPYANLAWVQVSTNRFAEKGGIAALQGRSGSDSSLFSTLGIRAAAQVWNDSDKSLTLRGSLGWRHAFGDVTPAARLAFAGGTSFGIEGVPIARDAAVIEAGFDFKIGKALTIGAGYAGVIASGARDHTFKGTLTFRF